MRLIDADELRKLFKEEFKRTTQMINAGETHLDTLAEGYTEADHLLRFMALTVDAVPVTALLTLRDELYEDDQITMRGLKKLNQLISEYDSQREAGKDGR